MKRAPLLALTSLVAAEPFDLAGAQHRPALVQSVEMAVPVSPVTLRIEDRAHLVYELHLTNLTSVDVSLRRIEVSDAISRRSIAAFRDDELRRLLGTPGQPRIDTAQGVIRPGTRAVAYFWISLPEGAALRAVRHTVEMEVLRPDGAVRTTFEGGEGRVSAEVPVQLDAPLRGGPWVAIYDPLMVGGHRTAIYTLDGKARIPGRFAIDFVRLTEDGALDRTDPRPPNWNGRGEDVLAVADGIVAAAVDDLPDNTGEPGATAHALQNASGNYVVIDLGRGRFAFYEHLLHGSVVVRSGDRVRRGQVIGKLGNSGSSSIGPHLHFHVSDANSTLGAEGLPFVLGRFEQIGRFPSIAALLAGERWTRGADAGAGARRLERPSANAVVQFP